METQSNILSEDTNTLNPDKRNQTEAGAINPPADSHDLNNSAELAPKYRAQIFTAIDGETCPTLCDTGCQRSCISENLVRRHPNLYNNKFKPHHGRTISIDGSKVETLGSMNIEFRIKGRHMRMSCRIVRNLVYDFVLGWDFFSKYKCEIRPGDGHFTFENEKINFIKNTLDVSSTHFSLSEDAVIPPLSKMHTEATFYINPADNIPTTNTIQVEPLCGNLSRVPVARSISRVDKGRFMVELLNPYATPLKVGASELLGHVTFTTDEEIAGETEDTGITLHTSVLGTVACF